MDATEVIDRDALRVASSKMYEAARRWGADAVPSKLHAWMLENLNDDEIRAVCLAGLSSSGADDTWIARAIEAPRSMCAILGAREELARRPVTPDEIQDPVRLGSRVWGWSYRWFPDNDEHAGAVTAAVVPRYAELDALDKAYLAGLSRWVDGACTTLTCGHKFMSSLAMTSINADTYDDIHVPWPALLVHIPNGSIPIHSWEATKIRFSFLRKAVRVAGTSGLSDVATISVVTTEASGGLLHCSRWGDDALSRCLFDEGTVDESLDSEESRVLRAAQRIVVGLLYTLQYSTRWSERVWDRKGNDDPRNGPPKHRVICFGQPVATDTRASLRDWIRHGSGGGAPPSVQSLVRGHYKRQVIGVGRTGRKVIWVEPYWRGPEDAPILARPYKVGGNHDQAP